MRESQLREDRPRFRDALLRPIRAKVLELAKRWYGEYLRPDWTKKSVAEARAIFTELGFTHPVWSLPLQEGRF